ncbi:MAG: FAD-dependent oxidoreductase [Burkholderiaceae bacterium]
MSEQGKEQISRRGFLKGSAAGAVVAVGLGSQTAQAAGRKPPKWDKTTDVLIIGYGGAGACAAIEAADAGAKVLVLEKQPQATLRSNTRMSGGIFHSPNVTGDKAALKEYAKAMFSGENLPWKLEGEQPEVSDGLAQAWADWAPQNLEWLKKLDPEVEGVPLATFKGAAFPQFPGAAACKYEVYAASFTGRITNGKPTMNAPKSEKMRGEAFWAVLNGGVQARTKNVDIVYEAPAQELVTNDKGEVIGAIAQRKGKPFAVRARRAVILTCGGYEYNKAMRKAFIEGPGVEGWAFYGTPDNTGDGIEMALAIGAGMMKAGKAASRVIFAAPIRHHGLKMGVITPVVGAPNSLMVDNFGKRYAAETKVTDDPSRYFFYKEAVRFDINQLIYPRSPSWLVFDETLRTSRTITDLGISTAGYDFVPWSKDNQDAIDRGWILKAESIEELAGKIAAHPENRKLMNKDNLVQTVARFNDFCAKGKDEDFGRRDKTLAPVAKGPFYALPLVAGGPNTKGGISANAKREVLNWKGEAIPRLFTAGELSSALKFVYQGGGNLTECIVMGRIAGRNAAAQKPLA